MNGKQKKNSSFLMQGMILAVAGIITRLIGIAYRIPVNNILGDEGQGLYGCAFSIYNIALLLSSYSLPLAVSKLVSARVAKKEYKNAQRIFKSALLFAVIVGAIVGGLIFLLSDFISTTIMSMPLSAYALRVLAPCLFIVAIMGVIRGYFQGLGTMVPTAASQIVEQIVNAIVSIVGASYLLEMCKQSAEAEKIPSLPSAYGAAGGTLGTLCGALFGLLFLLFVLKLYMPTMKKKEMKDVHSEVEEYKDIYKILLLTIAPVILSTAIYNINDTIDQGIFSNIMIAQGHNEIQVRELLGMFTGKYNTLIHIPLAIANALGSALIPSLIATLKVGTKKDIHSKINMVIRFAMLIAIPSCVAFITMPQEILSLLYSTGNIEIPAQMLRIGGITVVFYCLSTVTNSILQGLNKMSAPVKHGAIALALHLIAVVFLLVVCKAGIYSIIIGNIIFSLIVCILNERAMRRASGYHQEYKKTFLLPTIAAVLMGIIIILFNNLFALVKIPGRIATIFVILLAVVTYGIALLKIGALSSEEIVMLPKGRTLLRLFQKLHLVNGVKEDE